jgi:hypothetical protein
VVRFDPATGLSRLLLSQGLAWLLLAVAGLTVWFASVLRELSLSGGQALFWAGLELLAIAIAAGVGAAEVGMACRIRGGPKLVVTMTGRFQGTMLAVALIVGAVLVMVGGSLLELMALGKLARGSSGDELRFPLIVFGGFCAEGPDLWPAQGDDDREREHDRADGEERLGAETVD